MTGDTNVRVTNAVLGVEIKHVSENLKRLDETVSEAVVEMKVQAKRTTDVETCITVLKHDFENLDEKVVDMANQNKKYNIGTAVGAAVGSAFATVLAIIGIRN